MSRKQNACIELPIDGIRNIFEKNNIRFISVVMGVDTSEHRSYDTTNLLNYGFNTYKLNSILKSGDIVDEVKVNNGVVNKIPMIVSEDINDLVKGFTSENSNNPT